MTKTAKTMIALPPALLAEAEMVAQQLNLSLEALLTTAVTQFNAHHQSQANLTINTINQGDVYWIRADGEELGHYPHPYVVIQDDLFNHSRVHSVVVCALTTNLKQANAPGNVLLEPGEANLPKQSVVVVSKLSAVSKHQLGPYIGSLSQARIKQILAGIRFLQQGFWPPDG